MDELLDFFSLYLQSIDASANTQKNYLSDLRHFLQWMVKDSPTSIPSERESVLTELTALSSTSINAYLDTLQSSGVTTTTINRKISTLKKFFDFSYQQGWTRENPLDNITLKQNSETSVNQKKLLASFEEFLRREGVSTHSRESYLSDTRQFLSWALVNKTNI